MENKLTLDPLQAIYPCEDVGDLEDWNIHSARKLNVGGNVAAATLASELRFTNISSFDCREFQVLFSDARAAKDSHKMLATVFYQNTFKDHMVIAHAQSGVREQDEAVAKILSKGRKTIFNFYGGGTTFPGYRSAPDNEPIERRAKRLLDGMALACRKGEALGYRCQVIAKMAAASGEVRNLLWGILDDESHPQLKWVAVDVLSNLDWVRLCPMILAKLSEWDRTSHRAAILGAVLAVRKHRVPADCRFQLLTRLRNSLDNSLLDARTGHCPLQTELLVHTIATFGAFAEAEDLHLLSRFWESECIFEVAQVSLQAAARTSARYFFDPRVEAFFSTNESSLKERMLSLVEIRGLAVEIGALIWATARLLVARLGFESVAIKDLGMSNPKLAAKLLKLALEAERTIIKVHGRLRDEQQDAVTRLRNALSSC